MHRAFNQGRRRFLGTAAATIAGMEFGMLGATKSLLQGVGAGADRGLGALRHATTWLNSPPLTAEGLRGKVVLVDFCTYTCINWLRTLPYLRAWDAKYREHGLVVIGAHTPEFEFEHDVDNVRRAIKVMRVDYPIAVDNDDAIWNGFANQYWPALYLIDTKGATRFTHFGEGAYDESERMIQQVLGEAGAGGFSRELVTLEPLGIEAPADWDNLRSGENYLGGQRTEGFVSSGALAPMLQLNEWTVVGDWTIGPKAATLHAPHGRIIYRFHARDLNLVMGPSALGESVTCRVRIDGQAPAAAHGGDVDEQGRGTVVEQRLYQLIRQPRPIVDRQFEIEFLDAGAEAYCFTFG
jgi:thiol-disulfide isomerase/thioredoxin